MKNKQLSIFYLIATVTLSVAILLAFLTLAESSEIDLGIIKSIESSGNPLAYNKGSEARGHYQITPIVLKEWNNFHPKEQYAKNDLFDPSVNRKIAQWYIENRIPQMLKYYGCPVTVDNVLSSYNAGISYVVHKKPLPKETVNYLIKYKRRANGH